MTGIKTEIVINGTTKEVWNNLMDFKSFPDWNPFVKSIEILDNELKVGSKLKAVIGGAPMKPKVTKLESNKAFAWLGRLIVPRVFDGHHQFYLEDMGNNQVKLTQKEDFKGILVWPVMKMIGKRTKQGFIDMNQALKERVEAK